MNHTELYSTCDIVLAACLKIHGAPLHTITKKGNQGTFWFDARDHEKMIEDFFYDRLFVNPNTFHNAVKLLTSAVRQV